MNEYCLHCYPSITTHRHKNDGIVDVYLYLLLKNIISLINSSKIFQLAKQYFHLNRIFILHHIKLAKFTSDIDRSLFKNAFLIFWDEANKRNLNILNVKQRGHYSYKFVFDFGGKRYLFEGNPIYLIHNKSITNLYNASKYDNKIFFKKFLLAKHFPCPIGRAFISSEMAIIYGLRLGFPLVVKPVSSSLSRHVFTNIKTKKELKTAIKLAKQIDGRIIIERYIHGDTYRSIILDNTLIACAKREPCSIIGNGNDSIEALISEKNIHPWRGEVNQRNCTLHKIEVSKQLEMFLCNQGITLQTKLDKGQKIFLSNKINSGNGADITNVTDSIHPDNIKLLERVHKNLNIAMSALDFICDDIAISWTKQQFSIIENNSMPYIDIHHYPSIGKPINVAGKIWDYVLNLLDN